MTQLTLDNAKNSPKPAPTGGEVSERWDHFRWERELPCRVLLQRGL